MNNKKFFLTSDQHFDHKNISKYCNRPFTSIEEMNESLIESWNNTVGVNDTVAILGDLVINPKKIVKYLLKLNGKKIYVVGNHDIKAGKMIRKWEEENKEKLVEEYGNLICKKYKGYVITMCHYAMSRWSKSHFNSVEGDWEVKIVSINVFGHSHGNLKYTSPWQLDVGVDNAYKMLGEYRPFSFSEVIEIITRKAQKKCIIQLTYKP